MRKVFFIFIVFFPVVGFAQTSTLAKRIFLLVNDARSNPALFLDQHRVEIEKYNKLYIRFLMEQKASDSVYWDPGLEKMAWERVDQDNLNPKYAGENKICGYSSGYGSGNISSDPMYYICQMYTNVHDNGYRYFGIYFSYSMSGYCFQWGIRCDRAVMKFEFNEKIDTSGVDFAKLNTGVKASYMTEKEKRMLMEINFVRAYPQVYAKLIAAYLSEVAKSWKGLTKDTYDAGIELMHELDTMKPRSILLPSECVFNAAKKHGLDCAKRGYFNHKGSDGSQPWDRILKSCSKYKDGNENAAGNTSENPRVPVITLLLDDGISSRGHSYNMLDPKWKYAACYRYTDSYYGYFWIQNFAY